MRQRTPSLSPASMNLSRNKPSIQHTNRLQFLQYSPQPVQLVSIPQSHNQLQLDVHYVRLDEKKASPIIRYNSHLIRSNNNVEIHSEEKENFNSFGSNKQLSVQQFSNSDAQIHPAIIYNQSYIEQQIRQSQENTKQQISDEISSQNQGLQAQLREELNAQCREIQSVVKLHEQQMTELLKGYESRFQQYEQCISRFKGELTTLQNSKATMDKTCSQLEAQIKELLDHQKQKPSQKDDQLHKLELQLQEIRHLIFQERNVKMDNSALFFKKSMITVNPEHSLTINQPLSDLEYSYKYGRNQLKNSSHDAYEQYIKKYENFNKQVNDYLQNRKLPDHLHNVFTQQSFQINSSGEYIDSLEIASAAHQNQSPKSNSQIRLSSPSVQTLRSQSQSSDSPFRNLEEQNIKYMDAQSSDQPMDMYVDESANISTKEEASNSIFQYRAQMSTISEKDIEDDQEHVYQVDENGYIMTHNGQYLEEQDGSLIQLSTEQMQFLKSKNYLEEQK